MSLSRLRSLVALALAATLLAGCASSAAAPAREPESVSGPLLPLAELDLLSDPRTWQGESTAMLAETAIDQLERTPEQSLPATVTSYDLAGDEQVTVQDTSRVLGLDMSGSISATIVGLGFGDTMVGRDTSSTFEEVADLPVVTSSGHSINTEAILELRPTLVITDGTIGPIDVMLKLREAGIALVFVDPAPGIPGVYELTEQVAAAFGAVEAGQEFADRLRNQIDAKIAEVAAIAPQDQGKLRMLFLYIRGGSGIYYLFGKDSGAGDLIEAVGGIDVATEIGWEGMKPMTDEALIAANPDLILVMTSGLKSAGGVDGLLQAKPAIAITTAGQNRRFVDMNSGQVLSYGPRTADVVDALARAIYAPQD